MEYTKNYHLPQWAEEDRILMEDFNGAMAAIEEGLVKDKSDAAEGLAANVEAVEALAAAVGTGGYTCRIATGSYTGTGTADSSNPKKLTFDFYPVLVFVGKKTGGYDSGWPTKMMRPGPYSRHDSASGDSRSYVTWSDNAVSWYGANDLANETYCYAALGYSK